MKRLPMLFICAVAGVATFVVASPAIANEPGAHVHGAATLQLVVDGDTLTLSLESPLDSLLGFEHMPRTEQQKAAVRRMSDQLHQAATVFLPSAAAQCKVVSVTLESPVLEQPRTGADNAAGHGDLDGEFIFRCANPGALKGVEVNLFDAFPRLQRLDAQSASKRGQRAARLTRTERHVGL